MRWTLAVLTAALGLSGCGDPPSVEVTKLSGERFRLSVVAPDTTQGQRLLEPEAEKLCGRKPAGAGEPELQGDSRVVQEIDCAEAPAPPALPGAPPTGLAASGGEALKP